jgi:tRNA nucleotidyltransferase/poly(A) polymerase
MIDWSPASPFAREVVAAAASLRTDQVYLAGGAVRDLLLGRPFSDVDLVVTEGAEVLAEGLARRVGGRLRAYPQFLTFKVLRKGEPPVDITTARRETYASPGALPAVEPSSIEEDLLRRDFSINAIALEIRSGEIVDRCDGAEDLRQGLVRVLHDRSFLDDPTRILRGLRLAARLDFSVEERTQALLSAAVAGGAMNSVSRERLWRELRLAMNEREPIGALLALIDSGSIARLTGLQAVGEPLRRTLPRLDTVLRRHQETDREVALTGMVLRGRSDAVTLLSGSGFSSPRRQSILRLTALSEAEIAEDLTALSDDARIFESCRQYSAERLAFLAARDSTAAAAVGRCLAARRITLPFTGNDLGLEPGPHVGAALEQTREALSSGLIEGENALSFAREKALQYLRDHNR